MGLRDEFGHESQADDDDTVTRVRLDMITGELVITKWRGDELVSERRE